MLMLSFRLYFSGYEHYFHLLRFVAFSFLSEDIRRTIWKLSAGLARADFVMLRFRVVPGGENETISVVHCFHIYTDTN
jgi:hypothetical protein